MSENLEIFISFFDGESQGVQNLEVRIRRFDGEPMEILESLHIHSASMCMCESLWPSILS